MANDADVLEGLFRELYDEQRLIWMQQDPRYVTDLCSKALETYWSIQVAWRPLNEATLDNCREENEIHLDLSRSNEVVYLKPLAEEPHFVPVLTLRYHVHDSEAEAKLRVVFVRTDETTGKPYCVGLRVEIGEGEHGYAHLQFIGDLKGKTIHVEDSPIARCPILLPEREPILPVIAKCPVTLLMYLLASLYGMGYCRELCERVHDLDRHLTDLRQWFPPEEVVRPRHRKQ